MRLVLFIMASLLLVDSTAWAREDEYQLPDVVVTGSRIPVQGAGDDLNVVVIDRAEINRQNPGSVAQLLQGVPGIYVENSGAKGSVSAVYLRGAEPNYTLVLIDGVSVNDPTNSRGGTFDFSLLDMDNVERIEIVKGPASFIYGSAALAGVINIITRKVDGKERVSLKAETGSRGLMKLSALTGKVLEQGEMSLNVSYEDAGEQIEGSQYKAASVSFTGALDISGKTELMLSTRYHDSDAEAFPDASGGPEYAVLRELDERDNRIYQSEIKLVQDLNREQQWQLNASHLKTEEDFWSPGVDSGIPENQSVSIYERKSIIALYRFKLTPSVSSVVGVEFVNEQGGSEGLLDLGAFTIPTEFELERDSRAFFLEGKYRAGESAVWSAGLRDDKSDGFEKNISPFLAYSNQIGSVDYRLRWGKGFKLPSFFALGHPLVGDPDFKPEKNETMEFFASYEVSSKSSVSAALFSSTSYDLIDFDDSGVLVSRDEVAIKGVEINMQSKLLDGVRVNAYLSSIDMDIKNSSDALYKRPERSGGLGIDWEISSRISAYFKSNYIGEVRDFSYPTGEKELASYFRTDVAIKWDIAKSLQGSVAVDNIFGEKYQEAVGFQVPGALLRVAMHGSI